MKYLRDRGWTVQVVEYWMKRGNMAHGRRRDLFGVIDIVAIRPGAMGVLGVQTTARSGHASRARKVLEEPRMRTWLMGGNGLWVMSWRTDKDLDPTDPRIREPRIQEFKLGDYPEPAP